MQTKKLKSKADSEKLRQLYDKYKNRMYITACKVLHDPQRAEDAVHDAFIAIAGNLDKIDDVDSICTASYLIKAVRSRAFNIIRMGLPEKEVPIDDIEAQSDESLLDDICTRQSVREVVDGILSLDEKYRDVMSLYYLNEFTLSEIAKALGIKENTAKQHLYRGRQKLIAILEKEDKKNEKKQQHA